MRCSFYSMNTGCNCCNNFLKTNQVVVDGGEVVLMVKERVFDNYETVCLCITQSIPTSNTEEAVYIQSGLTNTNRFPLRTTTGETVYSYQLRPRTLYKIIADTNEPGFVINPKYLCHTTNILTQSTPATVAEKGGKAK
jgi:hypothetical protein